MKSSMLALSLLATPLLAKCYTNCDHHSASSKEAENCYDMCCSCSCGADPCFDETAYPPTYYNLQCDCGLFFDAEFLYWYGVENRLPIASSTQTVPTTTTGDFSSVSAIGVADDLYVEED